MRIWQDEQYRLDMRSALIRLDLRNIWAVGENHPEPWQIEDVLTPPGHWKVASDSSAATRLARWLASRPEATPERQALAQSQAFSFALALKAGPSVLGPEVYPLPS
jgi:hypothetical protein